ncbi:MAG: type II toxin-antitoxin system RelE/ParE family toxin [Gallionellaceae bacterium]|jgi:plasmid stabilization system protein ParE|nr:type II toxin-antitoxin system RelE/ParE family toxin [Gallionellaceae bacterium]
MPQIVFSPAAFCDLERLRDFLRTKNPLAARRAGKAILDGTKILGTHPRVGRPIEGLPEQYREWMIDFGDSGYVVYCRVDSVVTVLAIRHQREAGYVN